MISNSFKRSIPESKILKNQIPKPYYPKLEKQASSTVNLSKKQLDNTKQLLILSSKILIKSKLKLKINSIKFLPNCRASTMEHQPSSVNLGVN